MRTSGPKPAFSLLEVVLAVGLTGLLIALAVAVFVPLARTTSRYYRRTDQQQQTEAALDRMVRMIEASKACAIRLYQKEPDPVFVQVLQTQALHDVGPEARSIWETEVEFVAWTQGNLRYWKVPAPSNARSYAYLGPFQPKDLGDLRQMLKTPSILLCPAVKSWQIQGYTQQGIHFPLTLILETENPGQGREPAYTYRLQTSARPIIRHGL